MIGKIANKPNIFKHSQGKLRLTIWRIVISIFMISLFSPFQSFSQEDSDCYEISVFFDISNVGGAEIPAVICKRDVFISVTDVFNFLKINNTPSINFDAVSGFIINPESIYIIDRINNTIQYKGVVHNLNEGDLIRTETGLFLNLKYFGEIFELPCTFNFRNLMVSLNTYLELPIVREIRLAAIHKNLNQIKGIKEADTIIKRSYPLFSFGMIDWSINSVQRLNNISNTRASLGIGSIILGGETNIVLNYNTNLPFNERDQYYRWRLANNDFKYVKQIIAGKINSYSTSSLFDPVVGVQLTNTPTTYRRSFGTYTLSDYTKPGWTVDLYVNNVLVAFVQADASGFFSFEVPLIYGNTQVTLRFYGPWGEEQIREQVIDVPFSFVPKNEFEYRVSGGFVEDSAKSIYSRGELNYGLGRYMTIGGGVEYLSSVTTGNIMPFLNTTISLGGKLLFTGNYTHGVKVSGLLNYRFSSGLQFDVEYIKYKEGQKAIIYNYLEVRKLMIILPVRFSKFSLYTRISLRQHILPGIQYTNAEFMLSGSIFGINTNLTTFGIFSNNPKPFIYSNLSLGFNVLKNLYIRSQIQYDFTNNGFISAKLELEKQIFKHGYMSVSYEENINSNIRNVQIGFRFDFSFAQTSLYAKIGKENSTLFEIARGSLQFASKTGYVKATNRASVGRSGLVIVPFLDINGNGSYDKNEPKVSGLNINASAGRVEPNDKDTTIIISNLEPYTNCFVEINLSNIENIAWQITNKTFDVAINPNQIHVIEIPISIVGEVSGMIFKKTRYSIIGQKRITINIYDNKGNLTATALSEDDGYFSYLGLRPGSYKIKVDPDQLTKIKMKVAPEEIPIIILPNIDGDIVDDINFTITSDSTENSLE